MTPCVDSAMSGISHAASVMPAQISDRAMVTGAVAGLRAQLARSPLQHCQGRGGTFGRTWHSGTRATPHQLQLRRVGRAAIPVLSGGSSIANDLERYRSTGRINKPTAKLAELTPRLAPGRPQNVVAVAANFASAQSAHFTGGGLVEGGMVACGCGGEAA